MGMELFTVEQMVSPEDHARFKGDESFFNHLRSQAAKNMGFALIEHASTYHRIDPKDDDPMQSILHRWSIGVERNMSELEAREKQMQQARADGMREAVSIVLREADSILHIGSCTNVIQYSLREAAKKIVQSIGQNQT